MLKNIYFLTFPNFSFQTILTKVKNYADQIGITKGNTMNKEQIREAILGKENCKKEETPLCQFATFHPDMEMVEIFLKGADTDKSFNHQPLGWVFQFCLPASKRCYLSGEEQK